MIGGTDRPLVEPALLRAARRRSPGGQKSEVGTEHEADSAPSEWRILRVRTPLPAPGMAYGDHDAGPALRRRPRREGWLPDELTELRLRLAVGGPNADSGALAQAAGWVAGRQPVAGVRSFFVRPATRRFGAGQVERGSRRCWRLWPEWWRLCARCGQLSYCRRRREACCLCALICLLIEDTAENVASISLRSRALFQRTCSCGCGHVLWRGSPPGRCHHRPW